MNRVKEIERINAKEMQRSLSSNTKGDAGTWDYKKSWHYAYRDSAYVYVGGLPYDLSEGDVIVIFSQCGEIVDVNMPRDKDTGKPKGFVFIAYEDQRSTVLAVDNFNGAKVLGRTLRCDHCESFHEEQKKDANQLPEHVTKKLSDAELEEKKEEIERRNAELEEANAAKAELFAHGRGTAVEDEGKRVERQVRSEIQQRKTSEAEAARAQRIEEILARRKAEHGIAISEEEKQQARREKRRREEADALRQAERPERPSERPPPPPERAERQAAPPPSALAAVPGVSESKWERLMGGGKKKKKKEKRHHRSRDHGDDSDASPPRGGGAPAERSGPGDQGISVDETNRIRESLGLKPLR